MVFRSHTALSLLVLFTLGYVAATPSFSVTKLIVEDMPGWTNITSAIKEVANDQLVSVNVTLMRRLNLKIMVKFKLSKIEGTTNKRIFQAPKFNYCDFRRIGGHVPIITDLINVAQGYGNIIFNCPAEPGTYSIDYFSMSKFPPLLLISKGVYLLIVEMIDENLKLKPVIIMRFKAYLSRN